MYRKSTGLWAPSPLAEERELKSFSSGTGVLTTSSPLAEGRELKWVRLTNQSGLRPSPLAEGRELKCGKVRPTIL